MSVMLLWDGIFAAIGDSCDGGILAIIDAAAPGDQLLQQLTPLCRLVQLEK